MTFETVPPDEGGPQPAPDLEPEGDEDDGVEPVEPEGDEGAGADDDADGVVEPD